MERSQLAIIGALSSLLLLAFAGGTIFNGTSTPEVAPPVPAPAPPPETEAKAKAPAESPPKRELPARTEVSADDYTTTASGLQYFDIVEGEGKQPMNGGDIVVDYSGWLEDGTLFDSSFKRADPYRFPFGKGKSLDGWFEGVATMKTGGKRQLRIPPNLGYGDKGAPPAIPPGAVLIFDVELKDVFEPELPPEVPEDAWVTTESGLKLATLQKGEGATPQKGAVVSVNYTGWLPDQTVFDTSKRRGKPLQFPAGTGMVIPGWDEGVLTMSVGDTVLMQIPPELAYGEFGFPPMIPPKSELVFKVELLSIDTPAPAAPSP